MSNCIFCAISVPLTCSIVGGKVKRNQNPRGKGAPLEFKEDEVDYDILDHLKTFYILKEILKIRNETVLDFLGLCEGESYPEHWVNVCDLCGVYVKKFYENQKQILKLEKSNAEIQSFFRGEIEESKKDEGKSGGPLWGRIRSEAFKDFRTEATPLNGVKIKVDLDATPMHRESQNETENHEHMEGVEATKGSAEEDRGMFLYASSDEDANDITDMIEKRTDQGIQVDGELNQNHRFGEGVDGLSKESHFEDEETTETDKEVERIMTQREEDWMSEDEVDEGVSSASESEQETQSEAAVPVTVPPIVVDLSSDEEDDDDEEYYSQAEPDRATCVSKKTEETVPANKADLPSTPESRKEVQVKMIDCQTQTDEWSDDDEYNVDKQTQEQIPTLPQVEEGAQLRENQTSCSTSTDPPPEVINDGEKQTQEKASSPPPQVNSLLNVGKEPPPPIFIDLADSDDEDDGEKKKVVSSETETKSAPTVPPTDSVEKTANVTAKDNAEKTKIDIPVSTETVAPKVAETEAEVVPIFAPLEEELSKQETQTPPQVLSTRKGTEANPDETTANTPEETRAALETEITVNVASNHQELVPETIEVCPETDQQVADSKVQPELVQNTNQECVQNLKPKPTEETETETVDESPLLFNLLLHPAAEDYQEETSQPESTGPTVITRLEEATAEAHPSEHVVSEFTIHFQPHPESGEVSNQDSQPVVFEAHLDGEIPSQSQPETPSTAPAEPVENPVATTQPLQVVPEAIAATPASRAIPTPVITPTADIFNLNLLALVTLEAAGKEKEPPIIIPAPSANSELPPPENIAGSSRNPIEINGHDDDHHHHNHNDSSSIISTPNSNSNQTVFLSEPGRKKIFILKKKISSSSTTTTPPPPVTQTPIPLSFDATSQQSVDLFRRPTILRGPRPPSTSIPAPLVPAATPEPSISFQPVPPPPPSKEAPKPKKKRKEPPVNKPTFHENSGHFLCHICKFKTKIMERLQKHLELEHQDSQKKMLCPKPDCDRLVFPKFLHEHLRLGHGPPEKRKQVRKTHLTALPESPIKMKRKKARLALEASLEAALPSPLLLDFDQPLFKCSKCPAMEATLEAFKSHLKLHDEGSFAVTCKDCGLTMPPTQLEAHSKLPHHKNTEIPTKTSPKPKSPGERTKCPKCPAAFSNRDTMKSHLRIHAEGSNAVICPEPNCGWLVLPQRLSHHQIKHHPENHEKCLMCNINFFNKVSFQEHQKLHANGHICEQCGYLCKSIAQHNAWWHPKGAGPKSKNGKREQTLPKLPKSPLKRVEAGGAIVISQNNVEVVDVSDGRVECDVCGWMTKNPEKHKAKYHPKSVTNGDSSQKPVENPQEYIVAKKRRNEANSNPHYTTFVVEGRRHYKCKVCGAKKRSLTLFRTHYKNHEEPGKSWAAGGVNKQGKVKRKYQKRKTTSKSKKVKRRSTRIQKKK